MKKQNLSVSSSLKVTVEIKPSLRLKGEVGLFALKKFRRDSIVVPSTQFEELTLFPWNTLKGLTEPAQKRILGFCPGTSEGFWAPPDIDFLTVAWFVNHSCEPNLGFDSNFNFVAIVEIQPEEELFWDYSFDETNPDFRMKCKCGSQFCRGVITGSDWKELGNRNLQKYLSPHVKMKLNSGS